MAPNDFAVETDYINDKFFEQPRLVKLRAKDKRKARQEKRIKLETAIPEIRAIVPLTENQRKTFEAYEDGQNLILHGFAGTGKTFISLYLALEATLRGEAPKPIVIIRSVVPTRDVGFLPGSLKEKTAVYETPYESICKEVLPNKQNAYEFLKSRGYIEFSTTSFLRGLTFRNNTIIVDECQNMSEIEIHTLMTRVGEGCRIIFCGDFGQKDYMKESSGMPKLLKIAERMDSMTCIQFNRDDIVRSGFVREYIIAKDAYEMEFA